MKFPIQKFASLALVSLCLPTNIHAQATFQNLNFESANLPPIPAGQFGGSIPIATGLPGWTGFLGSTQATQVLHNNETTGSASIDILGPDFGLGGIIDGNYTAVLQAGGSGIHVPASLEQTGLVSVTVQSILFDAFGDIAGDRGNLTVSFDGVNIPFYPLAAGPNYEQYGGDVSLFAGQTGTLSFSESPTVLNPFATVFLDDISFSPNVIPEPQTWTLLLCAIAALALKRHNLKS